METWRKTNHIHTGSQQLWGTIFQQRRCRPPNQLSQSKLPCENRLDRIKIHRNQFRLELQKRTSNITNERICKKSTKRIPTQSTIKTIWCTYKIPKPEFGQKVRYERVDESTPLSPEQIKAIVQEVCGKFLYKSQAIDNTMQHAMNELCIVATKGTQEAIKYSLDYCATHPEA